MKHSSHDARLCGHHAADVYALIWAVTQNSLELALRYSAMRAQKALHKSLSSTSHSLDKICLEIKLADAKRW